LTAYWPLTFHVFSLKNDALNYFLPVRYQVSEALQNGQWPFWSPYFNLGYPLHGDMQSGAWNPVVWLFSLAGPYTLRTLQYETLLYVYLSGVGMFFLAKYFFHNWKIALLAGAAFMLCGFNTDSSQYLNWISGASYLPFVFLFYYRTLAENNRRMALCCGLFLFLLFVSAYPADFILTFYLLFIFCVWHFWKKTNRTKKILWAQLQLHAIIAICFLVLSLPAIISYAEFLPLTQRGGGASYQDAMSNPFHPGLVISYLTPLPTWKAFFAGLTDPLERNSFFGLVPFAALVLSFLMRSNERIVRFFKWGFIMSLLFSFGEAGGLRVLAYYVLPLMKTFRHPANAKLFSIFFACLLGGFALLKTAGQPASSKAKKYAWYFLLSCFAGLLIWSLAGPLSISSNASADTASGLKNFLDSLGFADLLLLNIMIEVPFLVAIYFWLIKKTNLRWLLITGLLNSVVHAFLFQPFTVVKKDSVRSIQTVLDSIERPGYPFPNLNASVWDNSKNGMDLFEEIGTSNMYNKKIGRVDYRITPSNLLRQIDFWNNEMIRTLLIQYPLFYRADTLVNLADSEGIAAGSKKISIVEQDASKNILTPAPYTVSVKKFSPQEWEMEVESEQDGFYCLFQNDYPRWQLFVDGKKRAIERCNISFIGFTLPQGKHLVRLQYRTSDLRIAWLSGIAALVVLLLLVFFQRPKSNN
jgi:hypothetical protein